MNDDRPIEKLLRRYAKKRRGDLGSPVELHPATRRLLQGEVTRQFRKDAPSGPPTSFAHMLKSWRLQLAWAVPLCVLIAIGLSSLRNRPETKQLALGPPPKQTTTDSFARQEPAEARPVAAPAPASVAETAPPAVPVRTLNQPGRSLADRGLAGENRRKEQELAYVIATNQLVTSLASAVEQKGGLANFDTKGRVQTDKLGLASSAAPARARFAEAANVNPVNIVPADSTVENDATLQLNRGKDGVSVAKTAESVALVARSDNLEREQAQTYSQSFANLAPEPLKQKAAKAIVSAPSSSVLANFRVEQTGRQLRVVDGDGSTYFGETDSTPLGGTGVGGKKEQVVQSFKSDGKLNQLPAAAASSLQPQGQNNFYRVAGTNRTLNQAVVFTWSYVEMTNQPVVAQSGRISGDLNNDLQKLSTQFPALLQNSFINGRAQFETGKEIEINAMPVTP